MKILLSCIIGLLLFSCTSKPKDFDFLVGKWKLMDQEVYEIWEKENNYSYTGLGINLSNANRQITERLRIDILPKQTVYQAKVYNQNDAQPIPFSLNKKVDSLYSFENATHDFPKKIQYQLAHEDTLIVYLVGDNAQKERLIFHKIK